MRTIHNVRGRDIEVSHASSAHGGCEALEQSAMKKAMWRLIPLIMVCYFVAYLDRTNIGIAALQMNRDLEMTPAMFGFGAGIFFVLYCAAEVPSNLLMTRFGVRRWVARIMLSWGIVACAMALVQGATSFYVMRALLGLAEAGFFPAMVYYLSQWFPVEYRGRAISYLQVAGPMSYLVGAPLSSTLLGFDGYLGMRGWQWMFVLEAIPAVLMAGVVLKSLPDRPSGAKWLSVEERDWLERRLAAEAIEKKGVRDYSILQAMVSPRVLLLAFAHFSIVLTVYGVGFFLPQIVKAFDVSVFETGFISTIPYLVACFGILGWGRISDKTGERRLHTIVPLCLASVGLVLAALSHSLPVLMLAFSIVALGAYGCVSAFWTLPSTFLTGASVAGAIAVISSIGALGGFAGPWIMGVVKDATGSYSTGLLVIALLDVLAVLVVSAIPGLKEMASSAKSR